RPLGRGKDHRRLHHLPVAWVSVPAGHGRLAAAIYRKGGDVSDEDSRTPGICRSASANARHARTAHGGLMSEFYVGYLPVPAGLKRFMQCIIAVVAVLAAGVAILLVFEQSPFAPASFDYDDYRDFQGVLVTKPYPALVAPDGTPWLLASPGKHGFTAP